MGNDFWSGPYRGCNQGPTLDVDEIPWPSDWESLVSVGRCQHDDWEFVLVRPDTTGRGNEIVVRCRECRAPRCGHSTDLNPCMLRRHHRSTDAPVGHRHYRLSMMMPPVPLDDPVALERWLQA